MVSDTTTFILVWLYLVRKLSLVHLNRLSCGVRHSYTHMDRHLQIIHWLLRLKIDISVNLKKKKKKVVRIRGIGLGPGLGIGVKVRT